MFHSIASVITILQLICIWIRQCTSWIQPQIGIQPGFLSIYSNTDNFVHGSEIMIGQPYTLDIRMTGTDRYDYLIQRCTYNDKYHFIDQNSCLICDIFFQQKWENEMYRIQGASKRTIVHFMPPEPLVRLDCSVRLLECCGCAERACERNILPMLATFPQQEINLVIVNEPTVGFLGSSAAKWPWWIWLLIVLGLILLLCLLPLLLLLCFRLWMRKRKVADTKPAALQETHTEPPNILTRSKELDANGVSKDVIGRRPDSARRVFRTPSESPSDSARSTASQSRAAVIVRQDQQQPRGRRAESTMRNDLETRKSLFEQHTGTHHLERVSEEREQMDELQDSGSRYRVGHQVEEEAAGTHPAASASPQMMHQQTTSEEKFFKKNDRQRGLVEEGYDRAEITYTTPATHFSRSEVV